MKRIIVKNISKTFKIGFKKRQTALERIFSIFSDREPKRTLQVLKDISFDANEGEIIGVIGRNGSGKSTFLRIIAGIIDKDNGYVETNGKLIALINLNAGIKERLTMRENIFLGCTFLGLSQEEIKKKFNSIVKFAELEKFINTKWYQFSDGMKQRVVFSMALHSNPKILLLDEVFAVGDESFRKKCLKNINELAKNGSTILLVGHNLQIMEENCSKVIWIDKGNIKSQGSSKKVINTYKEYEGKSFH